MRLRDVSERIRDVLEGIPEDVIAPLPGHPLIGRIDDVQSVYRPVESSGRSGGVLPWLCYSYEPFNGLIEPFNIYPGRFWALHRIHRQPSGLPELITHIAREIPRASKPLAPTLYVSLSNSSKVETKIKKGETDGVLQVFHSCNLMRPDRTTWPMEFCLPGIEEALPEGDVEEGLPGLVGKGKKRSLYVGDFALYNQYRTVDRSRLRHFLLNCAAVGTALRYVREIVRKNLD